MSAAFSRRAKKKIRITTDHVKTYFLANSDDWFPDATDLPGTRSWIEQQIDRGYNIYLLVGFHTVTNAHVIEESTLSSSIGGHLQVPASLSLAAVGIIAPLGHIIDPRVGGHHQDLDARNARFLAPGQHVCALQYRRICFRWLSSKDIDQSRLSKIPRWSSVESWRDEEAGEDDMIEVKLAEVQRLDKGWDQEEVAGAGVWLIRSSENMNVDT